MSQIPNKQFGVLEFLICNLFNILYLEFSISSDSCLYMIALTDSYAIITIMPREIETKFKIDDIKPIKQALRKAKARFISRAVERDVYYDNKFARFPGWVIRLRNTGGNKGAFTIKLPGEKSGSMFKIREELEAAVSNVSEFDKVLKSVGFRPCFIKEKIRETYKSGQLKVLIDKLPYIGLYIELEGPKRAIKRTADLLGLDPAEGSSDTYMDIFEAYKKAAKKPNLKLKF